MIRCPTVNACYGYGLIYPVEDVDNNHPPEAFLYRSSDAARSWNRSRIPGKSVTEDYPGSFTCVSVLICYTVAVKDGLTFLVTADGGARWTAKRSIARIIDGSSSPFGGSLSCPDVTTCFVVVHGPPTVQYTRTFTILQTTNAGDSWTAWSSVPCASDCENDIALACPTDTTCYVVPMDESLGPLGPGTAAVTHDGGVTWHTAEVSDRGSLTRIACPNSQTCVIVGSAGIYGTDDGGSTWQEQTVAGGRSPTGLNDIGCPAVNTCYAVGGAVILATHPAAGSSSDRWPGG
jgi:photosystem II stability/assembly factor-like uncharacterized protein